MLLLYNKFLTATFQSNIISIQHFFIRMASKNLDSLVSFSSGGSAKLFVNFIYSENFYDNKSNIEKSITITS